MSGRFNNVCWMKLLKAQVVKLSILTLRFIIILPADRPEITFPTAVTTKK